jgi:hypothetical protein
MDWLKFVEKGNISLKLLLTISALTGCLVFLPIHLKQILSVDLFAQNYKEYIGPVFLVSTVLLVLNLILLISNQISKSLRVRKVKSEILENISTLSYTEQSILREFYLQGSDALPLPLQNATVAGLIGKRILYQIGSFGGVTHGEPCFNYSITSTAKKYINAIPGSIGLPTEQTEEAKQILIANRPEWMRSRW